LNNTNPGGVRFRSIDTFSDEVIDRGFMVPSIEMRSTWGVEASFDWRQTDAPATSNEKQK